MKLNISKYREQNSMIFTDRDTGVKARKELGLDEIEKENHIIITIPSDTWGINPSFFGGLFEKSIKTYPDSFFDKYSFEYTNGEAIKDSLRKDINDNFQYILDFLE